MKRTQRHPGRSLAVLLAAAIAAFGLGTAARVSGLHNMQTTLADESGNRQVLQGLHLFGYTQFQAEKAIAYFSLDNGRIFSKVMPEQVQLPENVSLPDDFSKDSNLIAVAPEERDAVNRNSSFSGNTATSKARNLWVMREITLPDHTSLRLHIADYPVDEPVDVVSYPSLWSGMDWEASGIAQQTYPQWTDTIQARWKDSWMIGLNRESVFYRPGIWRVTQSLNEEEIQALPRDGTVQYGDFQTDVLSKTAEYGSVELFYVPQNLDSLLECVTLGQYLGILYQDTQGAVRFDMVDENAVCVQQALIAENGGEEISHSQVCTQQADQCCFIIGLQRGADWRVVLFGTNDSDGLEYLNLPGDVLRDGSKLPGNTVIQRSEDGRCVLFLGREENEIQRKSSLRGEETVYYPIGYRLQVYDLNERTVVYDGLLDTGVDRIWGRSVDNTASLYYGLAGELLSANRDCYTIFPQQAQEG